MGATSQHKELFEDYDGFVEKFSGIHYGALIMAVLTPPKAAIGHANEEETDD